MGNMTPEEFGRRLREQRKRLGMTQGDVALEAGVGRRFYLELEAGKHGASLGAALRCATLLGLDVELTARDR